MTITITREEVANIVRTNYTLPQDAKIVIASGKIKGTEVLKVFKEFNTRYKDTLGGFEKIEAIKKLREIVPGLGLAMAKMAVEKWPQIADFVRQNRRWPNDTEILGA